MRHKYTTAAITLARSPLSEASALVTLLTGEFGVIRARSQGLRKPGAKMGAGLQTLAESDVTLLKGKEGWRLAGSILGKDWSRALAPGARMRAGRVAELMLRFVRGEVSDPALYAIYTNFISALNGLPEEEQEAVEILAVLRILRSLGLDAGVIPGASDEDYGEAARAAVLADRKDIIARINRGIAASGL
ncbi:MAG TPA: recombination protein O N-terminal domain-containing protein [Candidatus Paceibacterota bacterium]|jgi:recombinational DNA repair protein (RecF pathway)|nr:recombination protein O N-terminal domain-containing protein [Candidatus Paceibacterota bacterium]